MKHLFTCICLAVLTAGCAQQAKPTDGPDARLLTGRWRSVEDRNYRTEFKAGIQTEFYDKELMNRFSYELKKDRLTTKDLKSGQVYTYSVLSLTPKYLTLLYLDRGNTLKFQRE